LTNHAARSISEKLRFGLLLVAIKVYNKHLIMICLAPGQDD